MLLLSASLNGSNGLSCLRCTLNMPVSRHQRRRHVSILIYSLEETENRKKKTTEFGYDPNSLKNNMSGSSYTNKQTLTQTQSNRSDPFQY